MQNQQTEQNPIDAQAQNTSVAPPPRRVRGRLLAASLSALLLVGTGLMISSARAAGPAGGDAAAEGMPMHRMHKILDKVGATQSQRDQIRAIWSGLRPQLKAERINHQNIRQQMIAALTAPQINAGDVEKLRKQSMASADKLSALITQGMVGSAQVLTPDQRKLAQEEIAKEGGRHHPWGSPGE
jgi:Spy/CpxP family protein refolding chaperone